MKTATTELLCQQVLQSRFLSKGFVVVGLGAAALVAAGTWANRSRVAALCEAVDSLNDEIAFFLQSGGCLDGIRGVEAIAAALTEQGVHFESTIQTDAQAATCEARAVWDPRVQAIAMRVDGEAGAREINLFASGVTPVAA